MFTQILGPIFSVPLRLLLSVMHGSENQPAKHSTKSMTFPVLIQAYVSSVLHTETNKTRAFVKQVANTEK